MLEAMYDSSIQKNLTQHIDSLIGHRSYYEKSVNDVIDNEETIGRIMLINASYVFFKDLLQYHSQMTITDAEIDNMIIKMDDLIDEFEYFTNKKSNNDLLSQYYDKAKDFHDLLVQTQVELGFFKVER